MLFLQGHGITHKSDSILIVPDEDKSPDDFAFLNVTNLCKRFAALKRCLTVVFLDACREQSDRYI